MGWGWGGDGAAEPTLQHRLAEPCQHPGGARQLRVPSTGSSRVEGVPVSPPGSDHPVTPGCRGWAGRFCSPAQGAGSGLGLRAPRGVRLGAELGTAPQDPPRGSSERTGRAVPEGLPVWGCPSSSSPHGALTPRRATTGAGIHHRTSERVPQVPSTHRAVSPLSPPAPLLREPPKPLPAPSTTRDLHPGSSPTPGTAGPCAPGMRVTSLLR